MFQIVLRYALPHGAGTTLEQTLANVRQNLYLIKTNHYGSHNIKSYNHVYQTIF